MVSPAVTQGKPVSPQCAALARAFERARSERLVCFPAGAGVWECKTYTLVETGPMPQDVACDCIAGQRGLVCKHSVCVVFCRKHHVRPIRPSAPAIDPSNDLPPSLLAARAGLR
jgi:hypothetical protein